MQIHELVQGTPEWTAYRAQHDNASDAPAMMGASPYKSRTDLLQERFTGLAPDVDAATQARFDAGHRFEALARTLAEEIVGDDLYPVTGSLGTLSASFDGLTMDEMVAFEHKTLNDEIRRAATASDLGLHLRIQMEQQLLVSGAEKCLFLASKWNADDTLVEERRHWYAPDLALRAQIVAGWEQFHKDLAEYQPKQIVEKPKAEALMQLPALAIQIRGEVTVSNLPQFKAAAEAFIANIKTDLQTDEDFANAEATVKFCDKAEKDLEQAKGAAIAQTASIDELMRTVDHIQEQLRTKRLVLEKLVKSQKEVIKEKILSDVKKAFADHAAGLEAEIAPIRLVYSAPDFASAMKNKRTLASLHDAVDSALASAKITMDAMAKAIRARLTWYKANAADYAFLCNDLQQIIQKADDDFQMLVTSRIDEHKRKEAARVEAERARIQEEERVKAEARARADQLAQLAKDKAEFDAAEAAKAPPTAIVVASTTTAETTPVSLSKHTESVQHTARTFVASTPPARPTDAEIIEVLALHFRAHESKVIEWLCDLDLSEASATIAEAL